MNVWFCYLPDNKTPQNSCNGHMGNVVQYSNFTPLKTFWVAFEVAATPHTARGHIRHF